MLAAAIMAMTIKLDTIEENQKMIMGFLEKDKESKLKGNLSFLLNVFNAYRLNWDNATFKTAQLVKTQDIKQESEQNIVFFQRLLGEELRKKKAFVSKLDVKRNMSKLIESFSNYRLAIYLHAFASYLEIILLDNYQEDYLEGILTKIRDESYRYAELYSSAYTKLEEMATASLESGVIKGAASAAQGLGKAIAKVPIVARGQIDENLISAGKKLAKFKEESVDSLLAAFRNMSNCQVKQFIDLIEAVNEMHNGEPVILVDEKNVYVQSAVQM